MLTTPITWHRAFTYPNMVRIATPKDGSCLLHALLLAYNQNYRLSRYNGEVTPKSKIVALLRDSLANLLASPVDPLDRTGPRYYDLLARGSLLEASAIEGEYTLDNMQKTLRSSRSIPYIYLEFIAGALGKDIYILDAASTDVIITGEEDLYQKGRNSIVILHDSGHYELIGIDETGRIKTLFEPTDPFIETIKRRQSQLKH